MTLGIAIPTYDKHVSYLPNLLEKIKSSTLLPTQVSVSVSSSKKIEIGEDYPFELIITTTEEYQNPSQNRNIAASKLSTDIISFIDGDDLPHPQRNEFIMKSFTNYNSICVLHNYENGSRSHEEFFSINYENFNLSTEYINYVDNDTLYPKNINQEVRFHNAHLSLIKEIFLKFQYNEDESIKYAEDSIYTRNLVENGYKLCYLENKLSLYIK